MRPPPPHRRRERPRLNADAGGWRPAEGRPVDLRATVDRQAAELAERQREAQGGEAPAASAGALSPAEFGALFESFRASAFRLETLSEYRVEGEAAQFERFL